MYVEFLEMLENWLSCVLNLATACH